MNIAILIAAGALVATGLYLLLSYQPETSHPKPVPIPASPGAPNQTSNGGGLSGQPSRRMDVPQGYTLYKGSTSAAASVFGEDVRKVTGFDVGQIGARYGLASPDNIIFAIHSGQYPALHPALVRAIIENENARLDNGLEVFEANVGDYSVGLMQIRADTAAWLAPFRGFSTEDIRAMLKANPILNVSVGMKYLEYLRRRYAENFVADRPLSSWIAASYNAGSAFYNPTSRLFVNEEYVKRFERNLGKFLDRFPLSVR